MNDFEQQARQRLAAASHLKDRARRTGWILLSLALALVTLLLFAVVDYWVLLPLGARLAGVAVVTGLIITGTLKTIRILQHPTQMKEAALDVEAQNRELGCMVSTAAEYISGERKPSQQYEPELVGALEARAAKALVAVELPYRKSLRIPMAMLAAAIAIMAGFYLFSSAAPTALRRAVAPWSGKTYTQLKVTPGDAELPMGRDFEIQIYFSGRHPKSPRIRWRETDSVQWRQSPLTTNETGLSLFTIKNVRRPFIYQVQGGDAVSPEYIVTPFTPPEVKELEVRLTYPAYVERPPIVQSNGHITMLRGSTAEFTVSPNVPLKKARLFFERFRPVELLSQSVEQWTGGFVLRTNSDYRIELTDLRNHRGSNSEPYHLVVLPDEPPKIEILEPARDMRADPEQVIKIKASATDDFGLREIRLVYNKLGEPPIKKLPNQEKPNAKGETEAVFELPLSELNLREYDVVAYHAEAEDKNDLDGPGIGKSKVYFIEITPPRTRPPRPAQEQAQGKQPQKANLLEIQKQIIADTRLLDHKSKPEQFKELAERQKIAGELTDLYKQAMAQRHAPPEAQEQMEGAAGEMKKAEEALAQRNPQDAVPAEENALAKLYQAAKMMPELQNFPTQPSRNAPPEQNPIVQLVLETIRQRQQQQNQNPEVEQLAGQIQNLASEQSALAQAAEQAAQLPQNPRETGQQPTGQASQQHGAQAQSQNNSGQPAQGQAATGEEGQPAPGDKNQNQPQAASQNQASNQGKDSSQKAEEQQAVGQKADGQNAEEQKVAGQNADAQNTANRDSQAQKSAPQARASQQNSEGQTQAEQTNQGQNGQKGGGQPGDKPAQKPGSGTKPGPQQGPDAKQSMEQLAQQQEQMSEEAKLLAQKLEKLAGKDMRLGHSLIQTMNQAAGKMKAAAQSLKGGQPREGAGLAREGGYGLNTVASMLAKILEQEKDLTDTSAEDYPREYETAIREYLRRLSHQE